MRAGAESRAIESLFWPVVVGAALIWGGVMALAVYAFRTPPARGLEAQARSLIRWGGIVAPTAVVTSLLVAGLLTLRGTLSGDSDLVVAVDGEQWWWRVTYHPAAGAPVTSANEVRVPRGAAIELKLTADDVIHSFWVPAVGGKMDMIPGRENTLTLTPDTLGSWGGVCAEYCGGAHAQMRFRFRVVPPEEFGSWLVAERAEAAAPDTEAERRGRQAFLTQGCGGCHTVRGTPAEGRVGPDLTHLAGRETLGAGILPMTAPALTDWIARTGEMKPGVHMPAYPDIPDDELADIVAYLMSLE